MAAEEVSAQVTVRASAVDAAQQQAPTGFVNVIDTGDYAAELETVTEALSDSAGVSVRRFGGLGAFSTVSIRGSSANQVQIYFDGVPLSGAQNEAVNLADLPLDSLDRIEVYRGTAPAQFGVAGIGGIVNLVPKAPGAAAQTTITAGGGSFDTRKLSALHARRWHDVDLLAHLAYFGSSGNFRYDSDNGTQLTQHDDVRRTRINNHVDALDALLRAGRDLVPGARLELTSETFWKKNGLPGLANHRSSEANAGALRALNYLRLRSSGWLLPQLDGDATLFANYERTTLSDQNVPPDLGGAQQDRHDHTTTIGGNLAPAYYFASSQLINAFIEIASQELSPHNDKAVFAEPRAQRWRGSAAVQHQWGLWSERILIVPTLRYEHLRDSTDGPLITFGRALPRLSRQRDLFSPALGVQARVVGGLILRGNIGRYERAPNFTEMFGYTGGIIPDPSLQSEKALNRDVGFVVEPPAGVWLDEVRLEYAYYNNDVDDLIIFIPSNAAVFRPQNVGKARLRGHEVSLRARAFRLLRADLNYTRQDAENRSAISNGIYLGKQLPGRPRDELFTRLTIGREPLALHYELSFVSGNYLDRSHFLGELPGRDVHSIGITVNVPPLSFALQARNLTDNQIFDVDGFPLPGRSYFGTAALRF